MEHKICYFNNKPIHYQDEGRSSQVVVLLHGFMNTLEVWASFTYSFMREMRVIAIDLPGHGNSAVLAEEHTMELMADVVKTVLNDAHVEKCVIIGHSMGGYVAAAFADKYPNMLVGFGFLHSHALKDTEEAINNRYRACEIVRQNRAGYIVSFIPNLFEESKRLELQRDIETLQESALEMSSEAVIAAQIGMAKRESKVELLANTNLPVLFIFGKKDPRILLELGMSQAMLPKHSEILILDNVAHMGHFEARNTVKLRIHSFVDCCFKTSIQNDTSSFIFQVNRNK